MRAAAAACLLLLTAACGRDVSFVEPQAAVEQEDSTETEGGDPTVVRGTLSVTVRVADGDAALASAIGADPAALAGAIVTVRRLGQSSPTDTTDGTGTATFADLVTGPWTVSVLRPLASAERAALPDGTEDVTGFAGGAEVTVARSGTDLIVVAVAGRQGGVIISEVFARTPHGLNGVPYYNGHFLELYNNGFDPVYLDGMLIGIPYYTTTSTPWGSCDDQASMREDSLGLWVQYLHRLPGSGMEFVLPPGATAVVAMDAIDHREFAPELLDLTGATFEMIGSSDVDNPAVPNTVDIGPLEFASSVGHGMRLGLSDLKVFVAAPLEPDTLDQRYNAMNHLHVRIPRHAVLDIVTSRQRPELVRDPGSLCNRLVHRVFDQQPAAIYDYEGPFSLRRQVLQRLGDGRVVLQRTKNSAVDLEVGPPTPGRIH